MRATKPSPGRATPAAVLPESLQRAVTILEKQRLAKRRGALDGSTHFGPRVAAFERLYVNFRTSAAAHFRTADCECRSSCKTNLADVYRSRDPVSQSLSLRASSWRDLHDGQIARASASARHWLRMVAPLQEESKSCAGQALDGCGEFDVQHKGILKMRNGTSFSLAVGSLAAVLASTAAMSQSVPAAAATGAAERADTLENVVVTARRREEALSDVPVAVAVMTAAAIETRGIKTEADLQSAMPGVVVRSSNNSNQLNYVIRGESVDAYSGSPPGVQPYVNEVPFPVMSSTPFYDLESVQAVKGPQGTLFGRNSTGGAVLFQTAAPGKEFGGYASVQYGNFDRVITEAAVNVPFIADKLLVRFAGTATSGGAYVRNLYDNSELGDRQERSGRLTIDANLLDNLSNVTTVQLGKTTGTNAPNTAYYTIPCGAPSGFNSCTYSPANQPFFGNLLSGATFDGYPAGFVYAGGFQTLADFQRSRGDYVIDQNAPFTHEADSDMVINKTTLEMSPSVSVKNIFGYSYSRNEINYDTDYSPYPIIQQYAPNALRSGSKPPIETSTTKTYSDELQLQGTAFGERLDYIVGAFYLDSKENYFSPLWLGAANFAVAYNAITGNETYAGFLQGTYKLTDQLNLTLGGRYTSEKITMRQGSQSIFGVGNPQEVTQEDPSWTASLDYHINSDLLIYATTRGSWRRGGFNPFNPPTATPLTAANDPGGNYFKPEEVRDVEGGMKFDGGIGDIPLRANLAVYKSWVKDIQKTAYVVIGGTASSATINVPKTEIWGVETDAELRLAHWLRVGGSITYTHPEFTDADSRLFGNTVTYGPFGDVPDFSGSVYADTTWTLPGDKGSLSYHVDVYRQSSFYFSNLGGTIQPGTQLPAYTLLNMRLDWAEMFGKGIKISLFAKNLTDKLYYTGGSAGAQNFSVESATFGMPRTYGIAVRADF
jgi:iron complex outermembrane receptor protein